MFGRMKWLLGIIVAGCVLVSACQVDPITGKNTLNLYSYDDEKQMGDSAVQPILAELGGLYPDNELQEYVWAVGKKVEAAGRTRLRGEAKFPDWDFKFYVVNSSMINAFALPGGHVFVTRGILLRLKDEAELAGLLGHECCHVFARHSAERMSSVTMMILPVALLGAFEETAGAAAVGVVAVQLLALSYSREDESEADTNGMRFAARAGYDPRGIVGVMQMLNDYTQEHGGGGAEFMSTHPDPGHRVDYLSKQAAEEYVGADAGSYVRNGPQLGAALSDCRDAQRAYDLADQGDTAMAEGFKVFEETKDKNQASPHYVKALDLYKRAAQMRPGHAILHCNVAQAQFYLEKYKDAERANNEALRIAPNDFWPNFMGGLIAIKRQKYANAQSCFQQSLRLIPDSPVSTYYLALACDKQGDNAAAADNYKKAYDLFGGEGELAEASRQRLIDMGYPDPKPK